MASRSGEAPTATTHGRMRTRRHSGLVPKSVRADSPGESSRAVPWAACRAQSHGAAGGLVQPLHCMVEGTKDLQVGRSVLTLSVWQTAFWSGLERRISHVKGGYCFTEPGSELYGA